VKLYHGTTKRVARLASIDGLRPRGVGGDTNWALRSNPDTVYLTTCYAAYFAWNARLSTAGRRDRPAIVEVDTDLLDTDALRPDEDALEQMTRGDADFLESVGLTGASMDVRTRWFRERASTFAHVWGKSLEVLGTCGHHGTIPARAVTRVAVLPIKAPQLTMLCTDPSICIINHELCGAKYRALTDSIFERGVTRELREELFGGEILPGMPDPDASGAYEMAIARLDAELNLIEIEECGDVEVDAVAS